MELPVVMRGAVCKGFGRGSRELGIPTANLPESEVEKLPATLPTGIYFGWARLADTTYPMVMSIGWNPFYKNSKKTAEVHIIHTFAEDFYGADLAVIILGYLRPEKDYAGVDALIADIKRDIEQAQAALALPEHATHRTFPAA